VRAVALALGLSYDAAYDVLAEAGRRASRRFSFRAWADNHLGLQWLAFPASKGQKRMNPAKFCNIHDSGTWIIRTAKHVAVVRDGVVLDECSPRPDRCIYGAWRVTS
jgi:hypothetical protein